jgi:NADPH2:quinone reductase
MTLPKSTYALQCREEGGLEDLTPVELPLEPPGPGEVTIEIAAIGINFADTLMLKGRYQVRPPKPFVPGLECAGRIVALGSHVTDLEIGQRVAALPNWGAYAGHLTLARSRVYPLPDDLPEDLAAALPITYGTAHGGLTWRARTAAGEILVVTGAAGGTGLAAVQVGKALGAQVIALARGIEKLEIAREEGADHALDSQSPEIKATLKELCAESYGARGADVVFDTVGGDLFKEVFGALAWGGRILPIGFAGGEVPQVPANILLVKNLSALGFHWGSYFEHAPERLAEQMDQLFAWARSGRIRPHLGASFPLARAQEALGQLAARKSTGKILLKP